MTTEIRKYVMRTSLFWVVLIAVGVGVYAYRARPQEKSAPEGGATLASGPAAREATGGAEPAAGGAEPAQQNAASPAGKMEAPMVPVQLTPEQRQSIGVKTGTVEYKDLHDDIRATGTVDVDERLQTSVQVRFSGTIRRVFADATYQYVKKGEPLFTIYSPELVATEEEYLLARRNERAMRGSSVDGVAEGAASLASAAEQRLRQWDIPASEIAKMQSSGKAVTDLAIDAPASGYVMERDVLPQMNVESGTKLYQLSDLSHVWVNAEVFQNDAGKVRRGESAAITVDAYPGRTFAGRVEEILPQVDMATRTVRVRLAVSNPGVVLKPGMFVNIDLRSSLGRRLVVPASAVFQTGTRQVVFLDHGDGSLEPKDVSVGAQVGEDYVVLKGLKEHEAIVTSANFLLDSESQLQAAAGSYTPPQPGAGQAQKQEQAQGSSGGSIVFATEPNPARKGANRFRVQLTGANGSPVAGAQVTVTFFMAAMPAMGMAAMKTTAQLAEKSPGVYEGTGVLGSGGTWQVTVTASQGGHVIATKQMRVTAEGGM